MIITSSEKHINLLLELVTLSLDSYVVIVSAVNELIISNGFKLNKYFILFSF